MRILSISAAIVALSLITSGCKTLEGMGKDIQAGGSALEHAAKKKDDKVLD